MIGSKELQQIGLTLIGTGPTAEDITLFIRENTVSIKYEMPNGERLWKDVPLLKEVHDGDSV